MDGIILALDVGTTKVCALVGEVRNSQLQIIGVGIEPSMGMKKGMVVDVNEASVAIGRAVQRAEQSSGIELREAWVSMAGEHLLSHNSKGTASLQRGATVTEDDIWRAIELAKAANVGDDREVVHVVPRYYAVDDHRGVKSPLGMYGSRLEVETHIITAKSAALRNLEKCTESINVRTEEFVLNTLASAEAVLDPQEKEMGVLVADIGGGTTDIALYTGGEVWHTEVIPLGGWHFTNDIAVSLRVPYETAEEVKIRYGNCLPEEIAADSHIYIRPFSGENLQVNLRELAEVIQMRAEELFELILQSVIRSGYKGLLPAGIVLTGGAAQLRNLTDIGERAFNVSARVARPRNLTGLVEQLHSPAYATATGLLKWAISGQNTYRPRREQITRMRSQWGRWFKENFFPIL